jgi:hypothetical protein
MRLGVIKKAAFSASNGLQVNNSRIVLDYGGMYWGEAHHFHQVTETVIFMINQLGVNQSIWSKPGYLNGGNSLDMLVNSLNQFVLHIELRGYILTLNNITAEAGKVYLVSVRWPSFGIPMPDVVKNVTVFINGEEFSIVKGNITLSGQALDNRVLRFEGTVGVLGGKLNNTNNRSNIMFFEYIMDYVPYTTAGLPFPAIRKMQNGGRGSNLYKLAPWKTYYTRHYIFDKKYIKTGYSCILSGTGSYIMEGMPYSVLIDPKPRQLRGNLISSGTQLQHSSVLKDHVFEGAQVVLNSLNFIGAWGRADSVSTDMPSSWEGKTVNISSNKQGGTTSTETTTSVITNARCASYLGHTQSPAGFDAFDYELGDNHTYLHFHSARKKQLRITSLGNAVRTISQLYFYSNLLEQDIATVYDPAIIQAAAINGAFNSGLFGTPPRPSDNCTDLRLHGCSLTGLPLNFNNVQFLHLYSNQLAGTLIANKVTELYLGNSTNANSTYQTGAGNIAVDLSGQAVNMVLCLLVGSKVNSVLLPTTVGRTIRVFRAQNNPGLTSLSFTGITWAMFPAGTNNAFQANDCALNQVFPLGTVICSDTIDISNNAMATANINATMDSAIDNQVNFADATVVKTWSMGGSNAAITNDGRPDRIGLMLQMVEDINIILHLNVSYYRINSIAFVADTLTDIIVTLNGAPNWTANGTISASLTNTVQYNAVWTIISRGTDALATDGGNGVYYRLRLAGFDHTGKTSETGVISLA